LLGLVERRASEPTTLRRSPQPHRRNRPVTEAEPSPRRLHKRQSTEQGSAAVSVPPLGGGLDGLWSRTRRTCDDR
jgi:hypothetical protein